jgi:hypothetical protein
MVGCDASIAPPAPALPRNSLMTKWDMVLRISQIRSSIASMFRQDSVAGSTLASITLKLMPFHQKSAPPCRTMTLVGRERAWRNASRSGRAHRPIVEIEREITNFVVLSIDNLPESAMVSRRVDRQSYAGHTAKQRSQGLGCR